MPDQSAEMAALAAALAQNAGAAPELSGAGSPEGARAAPVGTYYTDIAGTNGAWLWQKRTGTGNTGWVCVKGDTGSRDIRSLITSPWVAGATYPWLHRVDNVVGAGINADLGTSGGNGTLFTLPLGFRPRNALDLARGTAQPVWVPPSGAVQGTSITVNVRMGVTWITSDAWPTTLPGVP